jgi:hypothetical protein
MNNKDFNILYFLLLAVLAMIMLTSSWESYLHYLNRKQVIEAIKSSSTPLSLEQIQGLVNSKQ